MATDRMVTDKVIARSLGLPAFRTRCPVCNAHYFMIRRPKDQCGDLSQGQADPCPGRVVRRPKINTRTSTLPAQEKATS
jgi:hypothetical protein